MRFSFILFLTFAFVSLISPYSAGENRSAPHASADNSQEERIGSAVRHLKTLKEKKQVIKNELCGIDAFSDFYGVPRKTIISALNTIPCGLLSGLRKVIIYDDPNKPRALAGATSLHLRYDIFNLPESQEVIIHELGHIVDLSGLKSTTFTTASAFKDGSTVIYKDDPSVEFYSISWMHTTRWNTGTRKTDFVTGYAASDPFEDFSESFLFYIKQGNGFRAMAKEYPRLREKYDFLKTEVFDGREFYTGVIPESLAARVWDATKI